MKFIKKIINKVLYVFRFKFFKNQKLLKHGNEKENILESNSNNIKYIEMTNKNDYKNNFADIAEENLEYEIDTLGLEEKNIRDKEEFFKIYQAYKDGEIKKEHLLITDLIDIELMLMKEAILVDEKITYEEKNIERQKIHLAKLINEKIVLEKKVNM